MSAELCVLLDDKEVGRVVRDATGKRLSFSYSNGWRATSSAYPLSLSMPLDTVKHSHRPVDAFMWGLLPENERVLQAWGRRFHVSAGSSFALLAAVGEDCAGAVQFALPDVVDRLRSTDGAVEWIDEAEVAKRLRALRDDASAWRAADDEGQLSLAGAQAKTAFLYEGGRWGVPSGRTPTTHILKPEIPGFDGHVENEHFCLRLAEALRLPTARSWVGRFEDETAIVVERYDRWRSPDGVLRRLHQEDTCQAFGVHPANKYQSDGGPGVRRIVDLLRAHSADVERDVTTFVDALALNWLIAGTDAHAKNYSLLLAGEAPRLAPIYDVASILPYEHVNKSKLRLAMSIGGKYKLHEIGVAAWSKLAGQLGLDAARLLRRLRDLAEELPDHASTIAKELRRDGLRHPIVAKLAAELTTRADECARALE